jgi:uncharacterized protein
MKKIILLLGMVMVLVLSACAAPAGAAQNAQEPAAQAPQEAPAQPRTISVNGNGQVTLTPDVAYVYIGVRSQSENVADALTQNNDQSQAVAASLRELGIDARDIQTSSFNIYPQQEYGPQGEVTGTIYNVENSVYVTVRDLQILGRLLDVAVRSGANSINGITFDALDKTQAISEARRMAVESARSQAQEMAQAAGVELGELFTMNVYSTGPTVPMYDARGGYAMDAAQVPVSAGQMVIRVEVNVVYTIR